MSFSESVQTVFSRYATFTGRARRSEYWWWVLFLVLVNIVTSIIDRIAGTDFSTGGGWISGLVSLALLLPTLAVAVRRLHDTDRSGWWILIGFIPVIGTIVLIVFYVQDSGPDNEHGPNPKGHAVATA